MSAFILAEDGFKQLATELECHRNYDHAGLQWSVQRFLGNDKVLLKVQQLFAANVRAVNQRYDESTTDQPLLDFTPNGHMPQWSSVQLLKNLQCLSYQMTEGDVPESQIYKDLEALIGGIACSILDRSDDYESAKWGW